MDRKHLMFFQSETSVFKFPLWAWALIWLVVTKNEHFRTAFAYSTAVASNRPSEALTSLISFTFVVCSHYKHSYYLGRELNRGQIASVISLPWTLPQSEVFSGYGPVDDINFSNSWWNIDILYSSNLGRPLFVACLFNHRLFNIQRCEVRPKKVQGMYFIIEPFVMSAVWPQIAVTSKILSYIIWSRKTAFSPGCLRCSFYWDQIDLLHVKPLYA